MLLGLGMHNMREAVHWYTLSVNAPSTLGGSYHSLLREVQAAIIVTVQVVTSIAQLASYTSNHL